MFVNNLLRNRQPGGFSRAFSPLFAGASPGRKKVSSESGDRFVKTSVMVKPPAGRPTQSLIESKIPYHFDVYSGDSVMRNQPLSVVKKQLMAAKRIALGDLHGSYEKLLETLFAAGLASMPRAAAKSLLDATQVLTDLVEEDPMLANAASEKAAKEAYADIAKAVSRLRWTGKERQLILIGDVLADRGLLDTVTLDIIEKLAGKHPERVLWLASNHDHTVTNFLVDGQFVLYRGQQHSLFRALTLVAEDLSPLIKRLVQFLLKSRLMVLTPQEDTLYIHSPVTDAQMKALHGNLVARQLLPADHRYEGLTGETLPAFVEAANKAYRESVRVSLGQGRFDSSDALFSNDKTGLLWSRNPLKHAADLPLLGKGVRRLVHGHDSSSHLESLFSVGRIYPSSAYTVFNLDQQIRKVPGEVGDGSSKLFIEP